MLSCNPFGTYRGVPKIFELRPEAGVCQYLIEAPHRLISSNTPAASCSLAANTSSSGYPQLVVFCGASVEREPESLIPLRSLSKAGWSWGCVSAIDSNGRTIRIADAHRGDGKRCLKKSASVMRIRPRPL